MGEKEDWLILRNRKVLQESDEPEVVEVRKSTSKKKSKVKRRGKISFVGSNGSSASDDAATEDWLELRSRKVLQSEGTESGADEEITNKDQSSISVKKRRKHRSRKVT